MATKIDKRKPVTVEYSGQKMLTKSLSCDICGEPFTHSNKWGMMCDNECGLEENKVIGEAMNEMLQSLFGPNAPKAFRT